MIVTRSDVEHFEQLFDRFCRNYLAAHRSFRNTYPPLRDFLRKLTEVPQVLLSAGFQEYAPSSNLPACRALLRAKRLMPGCRPVLRTFEGQWLLVSGVMPYPDVPWWGISLHAISAGGSSSRGDVTFDMPSASSILAAAESLVRSPRLDVTAFVSPKLWTPRAQAYEKVVLQESVVHVIRALQSECMTLSDVSPRLFEEIVAEILRRRGMDIHVVRESPQGGRDIVARGQLVPGMEAVTIAVEVKHRAVIDRPEVQKALHQNRRYPALLFVTSGRFSGGVITEAALAENRLRLFLQDGVTVRDLLRTLRL